MAKQLTNQQNWRPWKAVLLFFIAIFVIVFGSVLVMHIGMTGLIISQLGLLATAIIACLINKTPLKEVFPIKKITVRDLFGSLLMWAGGVSFGIMSIYLSGLLTPTMSEQVSNGLSGLITSSSVLVIFIGTVILPPICEEAICRGAILSNLRSIKKDWVIVVIVGLMFALLHMDTVRLVNTFILGSICAYLILKRNNFVLATLVHLVNNGITIGISLIFTSFADVSEQSVEAAESVEPYTWGSLGALMTVFCLAPILFVIGQHLIKRQVEISEGSEKKGMKLGAKIGIASVVSAALLTGGLILSAVA